MPGTQWAAINAGSFCFRLWNPKFLPHRNSNYIYLAIVCFTCINPFNTCTAVSRWYFCYPHFADGETKVEGLPNMPKWTHTVSSRYKPRKSSSRVFHPKDYTSGSLDSHSTFIFKAEPISLFSFVSFVSIMDPTCLSSRKWLPTNEEWRLQGRAWGPSLSGLPLPHVHWCGLTRELQCVCIYPPP